MSTIYLKTAALCERLERSCSASAIRKGLIDILPVIILGAAALILKFFPPEAYQSFVTDAFGGKLITFLDFVYNATFGMLSVYMVYSVSRSYALKTGGKGDIVFLIITSMMCFFILCGISSGINTEALGTQGIFMAVISAIASSKLYRRISKLRCWRKQSDYISGADVSFINSARALAPACATVLIFAAADIALTSLFKVSSVFELFVNMVSAIFIHMGRSFFSELLAVVLSSLLWFFGIHGGDTVEPVMDMLFVPAIDENIALMAAGRAPTEIFTKQFIDVFVLMGGCGTSICLLISVLLFSKNRSNRKVAKLAALPAVFNINEMLLFGLPVIFNPVFFVPFIVTPIVSYTVSYFALRLGFVPLTCAYVNWTAPVIISGYAATGSVSGSILQIVNICIGVMIYCPFVKIYDNILCERTQGDYKRLAEVLKEGEEQLAPPVLTELEGEIGHTARMLCSDLRYAIEHSLIRMYYQPQYDNEGCCIGAESVMRWNHPVYGMIYPPLVMRLAQEGGFICEFEKYIFRRSVEGKHYMEENGAGGIKISINLSTLSLLEDYAEFLENYTAEHNIDPSGFCIEVTERTSIFLEEKIMDGLNAIKKLGYSLSIDDFSMGHTSLRYLQDGMFDELKLDGSLVRRLAPDSPSGDIIHSIAELAKSMGFTVLAECVETKEQLDMLKELGCDRYQGYFFSKPVPRNEFVQLMKEAEFINEGNI